MPDKKGLLVLWTHRAVSDSGAIKNYLRKNFSDKEITAFLVQLSTFEKAVSVFPKMYPLINKKEKIRRAVLSKELSVFYLVSHKQIEVLALIDNRHDITEWQS